MIHFPLPAVIEAAPVFARPRQVAFLEALAAGGDVRAAARGVGVSHVTVYRARRGDAAFRQAWDGALAAARVHAEAVLACRAIDGVEEEVWFRGEVVGTRRRYDARLLLAHLGRLDRLCADAATRGFADDFEDALGRFARGEPQPAVAEAGAAPEQCNMRNIAAAPPPEPEPKPPEPRAPELEAPEPCPDCGGACLGPAAGLTQADCRWLGNRIDRMDAARPRGARMPHAFPDHDPDAVEAAQLGAFEAGVARWWLAIPHPPGGDAEGWCFAPEAVEEGVCAPAAACPGSAAALSPAQQ